MTIGTIRRSVSTRTSDIQQAKRLVLKHAPHLNTDVTSIRSAMRTLIEELGLSCPNRLPDTCAVDGIDDPRLLIDGREIYCVPTDWLTQKTLRQSGWYQTDRSHARLPSPTPGNWGWMTVPFQTCFYQVS